MSMVMVYLKMLVFIWHIAYELHIFLVFPIQISMGDSQAYSLSTAENELGVVSAISEAGLYCLL